MLDGAENSVGLLSVSPNVGSNVDDSLTETNCSIGRTKAHLTNGWTSRASQYSFPLNARTVWECMTNIEDRPHQGGHIQEKPSAGEAP